MAQLRDAQTSELLAEGDPTALVLIAAELGEREVVYDDVGPNFNPAAVRRAAEANAAGLDAAASDPELDEDVRASLRESADAAAAALSVSPEEVHEVQQRLEEARDRLP